MEQSWRWFGPDDPVPLAHVRQAGATGIVTALHHIYDGRAWSAEDIGTRKAMIEAAGLTWNVCESIPVHTAIKLRQGPYRQYIDAWKDSLAALGRAGIPTVCYNFMPVVDWTRTDLMYAMPSTGRALRFDMLEFIAYDAFVLKRAGAESDYPQALLDRARSVVARKTEAEIAKLETNIIAGLPGGEDSYTREAIGRRIASFDGVTPADMRANLIAFLQEVVPVAEECGVKLAIHPDDPPFSLFGLPRIVSTPDDAAAILAAVESPANGLTLCAGSYGSRPDNDVPAMAERFAARINFVHLRNVAKEPDGSFVESDHLDGDVDMVQLICVLLREERRRAAQGDKAPIPMRPDHGHLLGFDTERRSNPGYSYIGRLKGLAELRGVMTTLEAMAV
ncbi:mannonate dehydratase [Acidisoma cellulosilytica]|uniref:Mannonate dehydratase n=1 Tax=Acidisoma cellulosilyticum TaxID=2802395 RepID=A0A964E2D6_9PROT|nr:mannonate dehydratase [Acidisoma cellulosilyticum]MCB8879495.1 mannonate dehydratase [Acidisoma cellulosilyticum]